MPDEPTRRGPSLRQTARNLPKIFLLTVPPIVLSIAWIGGRTLAPGQALRLLGVCFLYWGAALFIQEVRFHRASESLRRLTRAALEGSGRPAASGRVRGPSAALLLEVERAAGQLRSAAQSAREEKDRTLAILESMGEGVAVIDAERRILLTNSVLCQAFQFPRGQMDGKPYWEAFRDSALNEAIGRCLETRTPQRFEHAPPLSGQVFVIQVSPVLSEEAFLGTVVVFHDVTRLKELERAQGELLANVSHELKTPLTSILGFVETLKEGAIEDADNRMRFLQIIEEHAWKLHSLIEDLLNFSRAESAPPALQAAEVSFGPMLDRVRTLLQKPIHLRRLTVELHAESSAIRMLADPKALEQALTNLLDNAVKYNDDGGKILARVKKLEREVRIEIADTGPGIPEEERSRIFERFYRVEKSRARDSGGTGLGLAIVKRIVEAHHGRIEVHANAPKGSLFVITLPILE